VKEAKTARELREGKERVERAREEKERREHEPLKVEAPSSSSSTRLDYWLTEGIVVKVYTS
jgi:hypothetical protein